MAITMKLKLEWTKCADGYRLIRFPKAKAKTILGDDDRLWIEAKSNKVVPCEPIESGNPKTELLCLQFADCKPDEKGLGVADFVTEWGLLRRRGGGTVGAPVDDILGEMRLMKALRDRARRENAKPSDRRDWNFLFGEPMMIDGLERKLNFPAFRL